MALQVTEKKLFQIFVVNQGLTQNAMLQKVAESLSMDNHLSEDAAAEVIKTFKRYTTSKKRRYTDKRLKVDFDELVGNSNDEDVLFNIDEPADADVPKKKFRKSLDNLNRTQENHRTDDIWKEVKQVAEEEDVDVSIVLGLLLTRCDDMKLKALGRMMGFNQD